MKRFALLSVACVLMQSIVGGVHAESLAEIGARIGAESESAYAASPFSALSKDYFLRFSRDPNAKPREGEVAIGGPKWKIVYEQDADPLVKTMARHLGEFFESRMETPIEVEPSGRESVEGSTQNTLALIVSPGSGIPESFTLSVTKDFVRVTSPDARGIRDGVVKLVDLMGMREAPFLAIGTQTYTPRLKVRLGAAPRMGTHRDVVFLGYNAVFAGGGSLYALSTSEAIPELAVRRVAGALEAGRQSAAAAREYGLKTYAFVDTRQKFPKDDPVFAAHPEIRGALTWKADGEYLLCTEHPLVRRFLRESVQGIFRGDPDLSGLVLIIGGEGFYHCYMRPYGVEKGRTNCERCDPLGAETVVANLCNLLAEAAREIQPEAEVVVWPYSAEHVWSADKEQLGLIEKLKPGVALFTEIEKDEYVEKSDGVRKHLWDYSIDLIGPGERAKKQIAACKAAGIPIYLKSEPELGFEAPRLPHIPCMDRWVDRAEALASCGADGAWVFPAFRPLFGTSAAEVNKHFWWEPKPEKEKFLNDFAFRLFGGEARSHARNAWKYVSEAIDYSPELPSYYNGPYYLGPAQPMCVDPDAELPEVFYGYYLFMAEIADAEGVKKRPTFVRSPTGNRPVFERYYRRMEELLKKAASEAKAIQQSYGARHDLMSQAEISSIRWFYHTARTEANFYESCRIRDRLRELAEKPQLAGEESKEAGELYTRWLLVLSDELENAREALPIMENDVRLNFKYGGDHTFEDGAEMIRAKIQLLESEIEDDLPALAQKLKLDL